MALPAALLPFGLSLAGGLFGGSERPTISAEELKRLFGPQAVAGEANQLFEALRASPIFQQIQRQGAVRGARLGNQVQANLARRGVSGTPLGAFQSAASRGFGGALQSQGQSQLFAQALQAALQNVGQRQNIFAQSRLGRQQQPTFGRMIGSSLLAAGGQGFANILNPSTDQDPNSQFSMQDFERILSQRRSPFTFGG